MDTKQQKYRKRQRIKAEFYDRLDAVTPDGGAPEPAIVSGLLARTREKIDALRQRKRKDDTDA